MNMKMNEREKRQLMEYHPTNRITAFQFHSCHLTTSDAKYLHLNIIKQFSAGFAERAP